MVRVSPSSSRSIGLVASRSNTELAVGHVLRRRSFVRHCRLFFFAIVFVLLAASYRMRTAMADEWQPISPEEVRMTSVPESPGAPAVILYRQVDRDDSMRAGNKDMYVGLKILH